MVFDVATQDAGVVLQLPASATEGVADAHVDVFVVGLDFEVLPQGAGLSVRQRRVHRGLMVHFDPGTRHPDLDADVESPGAGFVMMMRGIHNHMATGDAGKGMVEGCRFLPDTGVNRRRRVCGAFR